MGTTFFRSFYDDFSFLRHQKSYKQKTIKDENNELFMECVIFSAVFF